MLVRRALSSFAPGYLNKVLLIGRVNGRAVDTTFSDGSTALVVSVLTKDTTRDPATHEFIDTPEDHRVVLYDQMISDKIRSLPTPPQGTTGPVLHVEGQIESKTAVDERGIERTERYVAVKRFKGICRIFYHPDGARSEGRAEDTLQESRRAPSDFGLPFENPPPTTPASDEEREIRRLVADGEATDSDTAGRRHGIMARDGAGSLLLTLGQATAGRLPRKSPF